MSVDIVQHASISGELSKNLWGRTDFEKYDAAWARAHNWMVDYRGGLMTRPGFEFGDFIEWVPGEGVKFVEFQFAPDIENTYLCIFTHRKVRFVQDNAYVLEAAKDVTEVVFIGPTELRFESTAHGFQDGEWVKFSGFTEPTLTFLNGRTYKVAQQANNRFRIDDIITGGRVSKNGAVTGTGSVARVYTLTTPYPHEELERLQAVQIRDFVRLTHPNRPIRNLIRHGETNWTIPREQIGHTIGRPNFVNMVFSSHTENGAFVYQVTAVDAEGEEGLPTLLMISDQADLMGTNKRSITIRWGRVNNAVHYNVYRSRQAREIYHSDMTVGYIGRATGLDFSDPGITPDFSRVPPIAENPFGNGRIRFVTVTNGGSGYTYLSTINWPAGGTGAHGFLVVQGEGAAPVRGLKVLSGGVDYTGTNITANPGSGATMTATLSSQSGNNPHCCGLFQQRMIYGATDEHPLRLFGSRPGLLSNFDISDLSADDDAYGFDLDSEKVSPLRHLIPVRGGLLVFNEIGVWLMTGRGNNPLSANNAQAELQNAVGASYVRPVYVDSVIVYITSDGQEIRLLIYDDNAKVFVDNNVSLLSNHLFRADFKIKSLAYAPVPFKTLYSPQSNGRLLALTVDPANSVYACTPSWTQGSFHECLAIKEEGDSRLYAAVERNIGGNRVMFLERQDLRRFSQLEEACCSDACLRLGVNAPDDELTPSSLTGSVTFTRTETSTSFGAGSVGRIIRCGTGKALVESHISGSQVSGTWLRDLEETENESTTPRTFKSGEWTIDTPVSTIGGLGHLEGMPVAVLADGKVIQNKVVEDGQITLDEPVTRAVVGLGFTCIAQTLPMTTADLPIETRKKDIVGVALRMLESSGLKYGASLFKLYEFAYRQRRLGWTAPDLRDEVVFEVPSTAWSYDSQIYFVQDSPRPATILNFVRDMSLGDNKGNEEGDDG